MREAETVGPEALVRAECLPKNRETSTQQGRGTGELPPRVAAIMMSTTLATFVTLTGSYSLLF